MFRRRALLVAGPTAIVVALVALTAFGAAPRTVPGTPDPGSQVAAGASATAELPTPGPTSGPSPATPGPTLPPTDDLPPPVPLATLLAPRLQAALEAARVQLAAPGISAAVTFPDGSVWSGAAGVADVSTGRRATAATPFSVASISKTFVAADVLALVEAGKLRLDDRAARLLPAVRLGGRALDPAITIRELLDHTSGLRDFLTNRALYGLLLAEPRTTWSAAAIFPYVGRPYGPPGSGYHYANTNYLLLGLIIEKVTGHSLARELRSRFFGPLGLGSAVYQGAERPTTAIAGAYYHRAVGDGTGIKPFTSIVTATGAAGSIALSAADLARWGRDLYGGSVLSPAMLTAMLDDARTTARLQPGAAYGLGVQELVIDGRLSYGHGGWLIGARSALRWFPSLGASIAVETNQSSNDPSIAVERLLAIVPPRPIDTGARER